MFTMSQHASKDELAYIPSSISASNLTNRRPAHRAAVHKLFGNCVGGRRPGGTRSGASLLRTSDRGLPAEDIFLDYWTLLEIERVFENCKRLIGNRPVRHRLEDRIGAYVLPCSLGVLLVRVAERELFRQGSNEYTPQHVAAQDLTDTRRRDLADQGNPENNAGVVGHTQGKGTS